MYCFVCVGVWCLFSVLFTIELFLSFFSVPGVSLVFLVLWFLFLKGLFRVFVCV